MFRLFASSRRWRVYVQRDSFVGASERCASAAALACVCRFLHDPHSHQQEDGPTATSSRTTKLRRAMWMRMHPVERWTSLVDLGRRGAYLIEKPLDLSSSDAREMACKSTPIFCDSRGVASVLGGTDPQVHFTAESTESHCQLCRALPYAARLHLCLSLLLWIRCLRDVQDTLARTRLPFASVRRLQKYAVADVFPTRLSEYWVDAHTTVSTRMNPLLNPTAEQIPAPHTWDAETSETIEDAATESTVTLDAGRVLHGRHQARLSRGVQLQQVQGILPRASADDEMPARLTGLGYAGGDRSRRRRRWMKKSVSLHPDVLAGELSPTFSTRLESLEFACDTSRRVPPVSLEPEPLEDARYHGNYNRGEGCPLREGGTASPVPIFIHVPPEGFRRAGDPGGAPPTQVEFLVRYCVMAHAAVLSSLFIEGRVVDVSSNHPLVIAYVRWLLEEFMVKQFVSVSLLTEDEVASYRPYFPPWCWRSVLVLMPPRDFKGYSVAVLRDWAARIVQAAPCTVLVEGHVTAGWYVRQLQDEVRLLQDAFDTQSVGAVEWMTVGPTAAVDAPTREGGADKTEGAVNNHSSRDGKGGPEVSHFQPQRCPKAACFSSMSVCEVMLASARSLGDWLMPEDLNMTAKNTSRHTVFLEAVRETLENRFYTCELLYSPAQSCLSPYCFERWVLERLPKNVRVVGINTSPLDVLYFFPQGVFLTQKVGNAFRYRAVDRTVVAKDLVPSWGSHPLRYASTQLKRLSRRWRRRGHDVAGGLHAEFSPTDISALQRAVRALSSSAPSCHPAPRHGAKGTTLKMAAEENASNALVRERMVEYLAEPSKGTLLGLAVARFLRV
ncbi:hypothetical protein JKF63_02089 [Porcisia hertigi]|uniref:Uncharacterized protein n=1 Tax=Porcisia hertigi TaxID=2761500 RepID=A0A836L1D5_9TRYP|nr:hypothetical protein JKF63_02089 [Porcisia hertigi]